MNGFFLKNNLRKMKNHFLAVVLLCLFSVAYVPVYSMVYYVSNKGNDLNNGTIVNPVLSFKRVQEMVVAGDTVYIRGGVYKMEETQVAQYKGLWAYVILLDKSGTAGHRIHYWAYPNENPVFDFNNVNPKGKRINAFQVSGSWLHIKGLEVIGVQVNITTHTQSECFDNQGSYNVYERLSMHDGKAIGFYLTKGGNNLILNCDAYNNWDDVSEQKTGGNTDGFGCHPNPSGMGFMNNVFRGCRAWFNSDDGYDCINAHEAVVFENCWSFYNGYSSTFQSLGDGNGFKAGGYGKSSSPKVPADIPVNSIQFCLAVRNKSNGFYANHHLGGCNWYNNSAYKNAVNYNMLNRSADYKSDVYGYKHSIKNNLGFGSRFAEYSNIDFSTCDVENNYFNLPLSIDSADFLSLNQDVLTAPRQSDGSLPMIPFMKLSAQSKLIDKGVDIGFPFTGKAPDLGCFELPVK